MRLTIDGRAVELPEGATVLDLASHDGRFSFAALRCGAAHVVGIENEPDLVQRHRTNMEYYEVPADKYEILEGDILANFQPVGDAILVGVGGGGDRVHYAVVSSRGVLRAPPLGDEAVEVEVARGRIRVIGKARAMQVDLIPQNGQLRVEKK